MTEGTMEKVVRRSMLRVYRRVVSQAGNDGLAAEVFTRAHYTLLLRSKRGIYYNTIILGS